jgi:hypothetical protein
MRKDSFVVEFHWDFPRIISSVRLISAKSVEVLKMSEWQSGICWGNWPLERSKLSHKVKLGYCTINVAVPRSASFNCHAVCVRVCVLLLTAVVTKVLELLNILSFLSKCSLPLSCLAPPFKSLASSFAHSGAPMPLLRHHLWSGFQKTVCRTRVLL